MKKEVFIIIILNVVISGIIFSQSPARISRADKMFEGFSYPDAIEVYESIKKKDTHVIRRLAEAYRLTGNTKMAEKYYAELYASNQATQEDWYYYGEMLKMNSKYDDARNVFEGYNKKYPNDTRVTSYLSLPDLKSKLDKNSNLFKLHNLKINSLESDFGTSYYKDKVVYTSSRIGLSFTYYEYNWNKKRFLNLYSFSPSMKKKTKVQRVRVMKAQGRINRKFHEGPATFNHDGTVMIFTRDTYVPKSALNTEGIRVLELWSSTKNEKNKWSAPQPLPFNNKNYNVGHAALTPDGNTLYFVSDMPGGLGETDIYVAKKNSDGSWGEAKNLGEPINTKGREMFPFYHASGMLIFASDGHPGLGGLDIFYAKGSEEKFGVVKNVGIPLNSSSDDFAMILDQSRTSGYISTNRAGGKGDDDIYAFETERPFPFSKRIEGYARDIQNPSIVLPGAKISLKDENNEEILTVQADERGYYTFEVDGDKEYLLTGKLEKYNDGESKANTNTEEEVVQVDVLMEKIPLISLNCLVTDKSTGQPISGTYIQVKDKKTGAIVMEGNTLTDGWIRKSMEELKKNDQLTYTISISAEGYLSKTVDFEHTILAEGPINLHEKLDLTLSKLEIGADLAKMIDIKPIYFDLGKHNIRPDAARELDKIVAIMKEYPNMVIELGSHTDCRSSAAYNQALSDRRAKSSAAYIVSKGIDSSRIYGKGYGESKLLNNCACEGNVKSTCSEEEHQRNRRTEFIIVKM
ncbi:MAG: OmpA family protein [Flavobacteriales bacterium]|nr:OmpA family protein [Flavobacteriales bacterium]